MTVDEKGNKKADSTAGLPRVVQEVRPDYQQDKIWGGVLSFGFVAPDGEVQSVKVEDKK